MRWNKETGDRTGAGLCADRKALWRESDTVPEAVGNKKRVPSNDETLFKENG